MGRKRDKTMVSAMYNSKTYISYYNRLVGLAVSMFEWKNLPPTIDERYLENVLLNKGHAVFFKDSTIGMLAMNCTVGGSLNVYDIPTKRTAYASNGYQENLTDKDSVIIYNNVIRSNSILDIEMYSERLYNVERTLDVNVNAQKTPVTILCSENQRLSYLNLIMQYEGNEPFIWGDKNFDLSSIKVLSTEAPFIADKLQILKTQIWNEALTVLGISNLSTDKKERMISNEVDLNMGSVIAQQYIRLNPRKQACNQINAMFGTNIEVDYRNDTIVIADDKEEIESE